MDVTMIPVGMLGTNCYLLHSAAKGCAIIDPGAQPEKIIDLIEQAKLTPRFILLTHGHFDHTEGVGRLLEHYPDMQLYIGEQDAEMLNDPSKSHATEPIAKGLIEERLRLLKDGQQLTLDELTIDVMETPGHTRGGVSYLVEDAMFAGDTLFRGNIGRCDLYGGDYKVMMQSLRKIAALKGEYVVYPGHGATTTLSYERKSNYYMYEACS